jgi:hypothetical protein
VDAHLDVGNSLTTRATTALSSVGSVPPLVSQRTSVVAPAPAAARRTASAWSGSSLKPSKKCSASRITSLPASARYATVSLTDSTFSSGVVLRTFSTCSFQLLATMQATGAARAGRSVTGRVLVRAAVGAPRPREGDEPRVRELRGVEALEKLEVLGVGGGEARLDVVEAQGV